MYTYSCSTCKWGCPDYPFGHPEKEKHCDLCDYDSPKTKGGWEPKEILMGRNPMYRLFKEYEMPDDSKTNEEIQEEFNKRFQQMTKGSENCNGGTPCCKKCIDEPKVPDGVWNNLKEDQRNDKTIRLKVTMSFDSIKKKFKNWFGG